MALSRWLARSLIPLPHKWNIDAVGSRNSSKRNKSTQQWRKCLHGEMTSSLPIIIPILSLLSTPFLLIAFILYSERRTRWKSYLDMLHLWNVAWLHKLSPSTHTHTHTPSRSITMTPVLVYNCHSVPAHTSFNTSSAETLYGQRNL